MKKALITLQILAASFFVMATRTYAAFDLTIPQPVNFPKADIGKVVSAVVGILLLISAILAFLYLILGGIQWITSGGDKSALETARNKITSAIVGLIIVAAAWAVMLLIGQFIGFDILKGNVPIPTIENPGK